MLILFAAAVASAQPVVNVGFAELMRGEDAAAIAAIAAEQGGDANDPAKLINLGIAHARRGDAELARRHFQAVLSQREIVELETSTGAWIDARTLARQALAMLDGGRFLSVGRVARN